MLETYLKRGEVLQYTNRDYSLVIWDRELGKEIARVVHGDILIVIDDETSASIKVMTTCGKKGWVYYIARVLLKMEHVSFLGAEF